MLISACLAFATLTLWSVTPCLKDGDLLFQVSGTSVMSKAIAASTAQKDTLAFDHVAIAVVRPDSTVNVIEASPLTGVTLTTLDSFLASAPMIDGRPAVVVKRLTIPFSAQKVMEKAKSFIGMDYDWWYLPDNDKIYCSELIYEVFVDDDGNRIFKAQPMNFRNADGEIPDFWVDLYNRLGCEIPEGQPGTNPTDLSRDRQLIEIFRFF